MTKGTRGSRTRPRQKAGPAATQPRAATSGQIQTSWSGSVQTVAGSASSVSGTHQLTSAIVKVATPVGRRRSA